MSASAVTQVTEVTRRMPRPPAILALWWGQALLKLTHGVPHNAPPPPAQEGTHPLHGPGNPAHSRKLCLPAVRMSGKRRAQGSALHAGRLQPVGGGGGQGS